jgi:chlorophyllide a reductase subunit Z
VRKLVHEKQPLVMYGSYNERMYLAEAGGASPMKPSFIPASFPLPIIRRHTGTPFMGYAGATYVIQEFCNALFDALFYVLPLGTDLDRVEATLARPTELATLRWHDDAHARLNELVANDPVLVQISSAKRLRDRAERDARRAGDEEVSADRVTRAHAAMKQGEPA